MALGMTAPWEMVWMHLTSLTVHSEGVKMEVLCYVPFATVKKETQAQSLV